MKIILVGHKHAFAFEVKFPVSIARVQVSDSGDVCDEAALEDLNHPDYSGTVSAHLERRSDMEDAYGKVRFGFSGSGK